MEKSPQTQSNQPPRPAVRSPLEARTGRIAGGSTTPHDGLKHAASSLKDSSIGYLQAKTELAAIEVKEASEYAKKKLSIGLAVLFIGTFTYAIFLILLHGIILQSAAKALENLSNDIGLNSSNIVLLLMFIFHFILLIICMVKLGKKPEEELFALTKSEFQKDKQWLAEINQSNEN